MPGGINPVGRNRMLPGKAVMMRGCLDYDSMSLLRSGDGKCPSGSCVQGKILARDMSGKIPVHDMRKYPGLCRPVWALRHAAGGTGACGERLNPGINTGTCWQAFFVVQPATDQPSCHSFARRRPDRSVSGRYRSSGWRAF